MRQYICVNPINDGKHHAPGSIIELDDEAAASPLAGGDIKPAPRQEPKAAAAAPSAAADAKVAPAPDAPEASADKASEGKPGKSGKK